MKWSMDTHKFMSEITRKALQILVTHNVTSESEPEEIEAAERDLAAAGIYKDFDSANGRIRRALFTYFKAYGCMDDNDRLTEIGRLFTENKISVQEMCFHYVLNYKYNDDDTEYFPAQLVLRCLKKLSERNPGQAYISAYDFSRLVECDSVEDVNDTFIDALIDARRGAPVEVNERSIGFDVWSNMLIKAGIVNKTTEKTLVPKDTTLMDWVLSAYDRPQNCVKGRVISGVLQYLPTPTLNNPGGNIEEFQHEGRALQAYLFGEGLSNDMIGRYIFFESEDRFAEMINVLGLKDSSSFYKHFSGLERLVGFCLSGYADNNIQIIGRILASVLLAETELTEVMPEEIKLDYDSFDRLPGGTNTLLYGVPGSGKSWTIEHEYCPTGSKVERLVFHPDYTNADFIGQILPIVDQDKMVTYEFVPGPFTAILKEAYVNPLREYILIIEEINRGNAPAIFGEVFQLLDRKIVTGTDGFPIGTSEYGITNKYMAEYIYGDASHKVRIPSNLFLLGTMNTSDQNVFTLDTAFQRRWRMRLIENNFDNVRRSLADAKILDTEVTWKRFCDTVNNIITGNKAKMASAEDKRLGVYFIHENDVLFDDRALPSPDYVTLLVEYNDLVRHETIGDITGDQEIRLSNIREAVIHNRLFPEKVIKYLWDDAFKFNPEALFDTDNMDSLEKVIRTFVYSKGPERFKIFKSTVRSLLYPAATPQTDAE